MVYIVSYDVSIIISIINSEGLAGSYNGFLAPVPALTSHSVALSLRVTEDSPVNVVHLALLGLQAPVDPLELLETKALRLFYVFQTFN